MRYDTHTKRFCVSRSLDLPANDLSSDFEQARIVPERRRRVESEFSEITVSRIEKPVVVRDRKSGRDDQNGSSKFSDERVSHCG